MNGTATAPITLNQTQQVAPVKISKGNPDNDTLRPNTVQALIRRDLVEIDPDGLLTVTERGHAFLDAQEADEELKSEGTTSTEDKGAKDAEKPATGRKRALGSDGAPEAHCAAVARRVREDQGLRQVAGQDPRYRREGVRRQRVDPGRPRRDRHPDRLLRHDLGRHRRGPRSTPCSRCVHPPRGVLPPAQGHRRREGARDPLIRLE